MKTSIATIALYLVLDSVQAATVITGHVDRIYLDGNKLGITLVDDQDNPVLFTGEGCSLTNMGVIPYQAGSIMDNHARALWLEAKRYNYVIDVAFYGCTGDYSRITATQIMQ